MDLSQRLRRQRTKPVFEVTTRLGRRIKVTSTHPLLTLTGWKPLADLSVGTAIAVPRRIDAFGNEPVGEHRARLLGYLLGDGGLTGTGPSFTNSNPSLLEDFRDAVRRFGGVRVTESKRNGRVSTLSVVADEAVKREARSRFATSLESALAGYGRPARHLAAAIGANPASITAWRQGRCVPGPAAADALALVARRRSSVPAAARRNAPNALTCWLRELGLMGCGARQKFVPEVRLSRAQGGGARVSQPAVRDRRLDHDAFERAGAGRLLLGQREARTPGAASASSLRGDRLDSPPASPLPRWPSRGVAARYHGRSLDIGTRRGDRNPRQGGARQARARRSRQSSSPRQPRPDSGRRLDDHRSGTRADVVGGSRAGARASPRLELPPRQAWRQPEAARVGSPVS